jgi:hypothetical protein
MANLLNFTLSVRVRAGQSPVLLPRSPEGTRRNQKPTSLVKTLARLADSNRECWSAFRMSALGNGAIPKRVAAR